MALFSTNLKILAIHHDIILLEQIQQMCDPYHYLLTKCTSAFDAYNLLVERKDYFDLMLIDVCMQNIDSYEFVRYVTLQHNIPVIVISSDATKSSLIKSVIYGACAYWVQPLHEKQFKTMWQYVVRKKLVENRAEHQVLGFPKVQSPKEHDVVGFLKEQSPKEHDVVGFLEGQHERKREREDGNPTKETSAKKSRLSWTPQLHQQFVNAVNQLGFEKAKPRRILKIMDVCGLTTAQIASHLQKYRECLKSKKSPRIDTPTECINTILQEDQSSQLNSNLQNEANSETQESNDVSDSINNDYPGAFDLLLDYDELISFEAYECD